MNGKNNFTNIITDQIRSSTCVLPLTPIQPVRFLDQMPDNCTILMKLLYYNDGTPEHYETPFCKYYFGVSTTYVWAKNSLKREVWNVNNNSFVLPLKFASILEPCEDENDALLRLMKSHTLPFGDPLPLCMPTVGTIGDAEEFLKLLIVHHFPSSLTYSNVFTLFF